MSHDARPISPTRFREAIQDLPIGNLHAKAAELLNSVEHLKRSNADLAAFPDDVDCKQAVAENLEVISRMEERVLMLRQEVVGRGMRWVEGEEGYRILEPGETESSTGNVNGVNGNRAGANGVGQAAAGRSVGATSGGTATAASGTLSDEQLRRLLAERMGAPDDEEEEGVHL
jgi:hypothetical protein